MTLTKYPFDSELESETIYVDEKGNIEITKFRGPKGIPRIQILDKSDGSIIFMNFNKWSSIMNINEEEQIKNKSHIKALENKIANLTKLADSLFKALIDSPSA
jgi:hypothetical protein